MGERERRRTDRHAVVVGVVRFVVVAVICGGVGLWFRWLFNSVVSDLVRGVSLPVWVVVAFAAGLGGLAGWLGMRGSGRYVAPGGDVEPVAGSRALGIVVANRRAEQQRPLTPGGVAVRVWSADLLHGGDRDDDEAGAVTS